MLFRKYKVNAKEFRAAMDGASLEKRRFWPDFFNRKKVQSLEQEISAYRKQVESLRSDVNALEKIKDKLEAELGRNKKVSSRIPSKQASSLATNAKSASEASVRSVRYTSEQLACDKGELTIGASVAIGAAIVSEVMDTSSDSCSSSSISD